MSLTLRAVTSARLLAAATRTRAFCSGADDSSGDSKNDLKKLMKKHKLKEEKTPPAPATATNEESQSKPESNAKLNDLLLKLNEKRAASKQNEAIKMTKPNIVLEDDLDPVSVKGVEPDVIVAAHKVSTHLAKDDRVETKRIESDLVKRLRTIAEDTDSNREAMAGGEKGPDLAQMLSTFKVHMLNFRLEMRPRFNGLNCRSTRARRLKKPTSPKTKWISWSGGGSSGKRRASVEVAKRLPRVPLTMTGRRVSLEGSRWEFSRRQTESRAQGTERLFD